MRFRFRFPVRAIRLLSMHALAASAQAVDAKVDGGRLLLVRHGQTNFNAEGRLQGRLESELTDVGHQQAQALGKWIANHEAHIRQSFVSVRYRTHQTLANIEAYATNLPTAEVRPGLREIELTAWEGQLKSDVSHSDGERWAQWKAHPDGFVFSEDGHSPLGDLQTRASGEWTALLQATPPGTTSLVVAHGAFNRAFLLTALGLPVDDYGFRDVAKRFDLANCAVVELIWAAGAAHASAWRLRYPSETAWSSREEELAIRQHDLAGAGKGEL